MNSALKIDRVVHPSKEHIHVSKGDVQMKHVPNKEFRFGNSTVIIHSPLVNMTAQERKEWYDQEWEKGNQVLKGIVEAVQDCLQSSS